MSLQNQRRRNENYRLKYNNLTNHNDLTYSLSTNILICVNLPKLTVKQREILKLLYKYRFLNRIQIQAFLKHKDHKTINLWLKNLRENDYVEWIYSTHFAEKTKPAIYYLGINGIRHFKAFGYYDTAELRKRYREADRSRTYIDRCLLVADCCITLERARKINKYEGSFYMYETEADYLVASYYHFLTESDIRPHLCFSKQVYEGSDEPHSIEMYLLHIFDPTLPRYRMKKRLSEYVTYLDEELDEWQEITDTDKPPIILFVCPRTSDLIYAKRRTRGLLSDIWEPDDEDRPFIRFATADKLKQLGLRAKIWEEA